MRLLKRLMKLGQKSVASQNMRPVCLIVWVLQAVFFLNRHHYGTHDVRHEPEHELENVVIATSDSVHDHQWYFTVNTDYGAGGGWEEECKLCYPAVQWRRSGPNSLLLSIQGFRIHPFLHDRCNIIIIIVDCAVTICMIMSADSQIIYLHVMNEWYDVIIVTVGGWNDFYDSRQQ